MIMLAISIALLLLMAGVWAGFSVYEHSQKLKNEKQVEKKKAASRKADL